MSTAADAMAAAIDAVRDGDGESMQDVARDILAALERAGWVLVPKDLLERAAANLRVDPEVYHTELVSELEAAILKGAPK